MMKYKYYYALLGMLLILSCGKEELSVEAPDFDVTTATTTYRAGQEITFNIVKGGDADIISFYSGETLKDFAFKDGRTIDVSKSGFTLQFTSSVQLGTQANQLTVLASTDFNGDYSSLSKVKQATWIDITNRFALGTTATFLNSGTKEFSDLVVAGKPIYFAYKYITKPQQINGLARTWYIQGFTVKSLATQENTASPTPIELILADQGRTGFRVIDENEAAVKSPFFIPYDKAPAQSSVSLTRVTLNGNRYLTPDLAIFNPNNPIFDPENPMYNPSKPEYVPTAVRPTFVPYNLQSPYNDPLSEHWAVSAAIKLDKVELGPDLATNIKGTMTTSSLGSFNYTFVKAGTYKVVFIASNNSVNDNKSVVKEINLTILP